MEAFQRGDVETTRRTWSPSIVWHTARAEYRGPDEIFRYLAGLAERSGGTFDPQLVTVLGEATRVVAVFRLLATRDDRRLDQLATLLIDLGEGPVVTEVWELHANEEAWRRFWE